VEIVYRDGDGNRVEGSDFSKETFETETPAVRGEGNCFLHHINFKLHLVIFRKHQNYPCHFYFKGRVRMEEMLIEIGF